MMTRARIVLAASSVLFVGCLAGHAGDGEDSSSLTRDGKVCGPPSYNCSRTDKAIVQLSTIPDVTAGINTTVKDPLFLNPIVRCTGVGSETAHPNFTFSGGMGGSGDVGSLWNTSSTALHINDQGGRGFLMEFNPTKMQCGHFFTDESGAQFNVGAGMFSKTVPTIWYAYGENGDITSPTQINAYTIDQQAGTIALSPEALVADFIHAIGHDAPEYGAMVTGKVTTSDWSAASAKLCTVSSNTTPPAGAHSYNGSMIVPSANNPSGHAFVCIIAGTTAAATAEPVWSRFYGGDVTDGGAKWADLGAPPEFVYQLTGPASGGKSSASTPRFPPGLLYTVEDSGLTWTNIGVVEDANWVRSSATRSSTVA